MEYTKSNRMKKINKKLRFLKFCSSPCWLFLLTFSVMSTLPVFAAGDASFSISPSSGSYTVGSNFTVTIDETSSSGDNTNAVQANLSYDASILQYTSSSLGVFTLCTQNGGGSGSANFACAATSSQNGTQEVAAINFKVIASGAASVAMTSGSNIDNTSGTSVWNGSLPSASFSLKAPATTASPQASVSSPTYIPSTMPSVSTKTAQKTTTPSKSTASTRTKSVVKAPMLAAVTIIVVDANGQPVKGAKVVLDGKNTEYSDNQGKANFSVEASGSHTVTVTDPGKQPYHTKVVLIAGQSVPIELQLANAKSFGLLYRVFSAMGVLLLVGLCYWLFKSRFSRLPWAHDVTTQFASPANFVGNSSMDGVQVPSDTQVIHQQAGEMQTSSTRQKRSYYLRRRDGFDILRRKF